MKKIVIAGGHLTPALALIEELEKDKNTKIYFFGRKYATEGLDNLSAEYQIIKKKQINFFAITTGRIQRKFTRYTFPSILKIPVGFIQSFFYLLKVRPNVIVSFGSYVSVPTVFAGWLLGIDSIIHEQASIPGLATKINSLFAKKIFLTWRESGKYFDSKKTAVVGNLIRRAIFDKKTKGKEIKNFLDKSKNLIFVTGGNQGSHFINELIFESQNKLKNFCIIHQLGTANFERDQKKAKKIKSANYQAVNYIDTQNIGAVLNCADIIIGRAGANTIYELALLAKPAILIPLTVTSGNEQQENAEVLAKSGSAIILSQGKITEELFVDTVKSMFENLPKYQKSAQQLSKSLKKDAAEKLAKYIILEL